jgi:hypothetical protein
LTAPVAAGAPPILVIATTNDPATPYADGAALSRQLQSGVLLTHVGEGHTVYNQGNVCIDTAVNAYLLDLTPIASGSSCDDSGAALMPPPRPDSMPFALVTPGVAKGP